MSDEKALEFSFQKDGIWMEKGVFHHPLLDVISAHGVTEEFVQRLLNRRKCLCEQAFAANDWLRYIQLHQPLSRDLALYEIQHILSPVEFLRCVAAIWRDPTSTCGSSDMVAHATSRLSTKQIRETILTKVEQNIIDGHSRELCLFRATSVFDFGFIWVGSLGNAKAWQETLQTTHVLRGLFKIEDIMAVIDSPYGIEYWVNIKCALELDDFLSSGPESQ